MAHFLYKMPIDLRCIVWYHLQRQQNKIITERNDNNMQYLGGKSRIANSIAEIINENDCKVFVSLFCGSCAVETKVKASKKILNDKHPYLISMWRSLQEGWEPPDTITKEEYYAIKKDLPYNPSLAGFVGFGCSFGGKWFGGYASNKK